MNKKFLLYCSDSYYGSGFYHGNTYSWEDNKDIIIEDVMDKIECDNTPSESIYENDYFIQVGSI